VALQHLPLPGRLPAARGGRGAPALVSGKETSGYKRRLDPRRPLVVYSVGSRDETSFEEAVRRLLGVSPHTMDPSLSADKQEHLRSLPCIHFHNLGLTGRTRSAGTAPGGPLVRFTEVMAMLNHTYVDVLGIDREVSVPQHPCSENCDLRHGCGVWEVPAVSVPCCTPALRGYSQLDLALPGANAALSAGPVVWWGGAVQGCEVDVMQDLFASSSARVPPVGQVLMEIHQ